jgi:hypothetical protein
MEKAAGKIKEWRREVSNNGPLFSLHFSSEVENHFILHEFLPAHRKI